MNSRSLTGLVAALALSPALSATAAPAAVAAPDKDAADVAAEVIAAGGNAADAAVAIGFSLAVTYPEAGNIGGGGLATLYFKGKAYFLDYRERAPSAASANMYLDAHGRVVPDASTIGARAAGVPGTVAGLWELHHRFGRLPWARDLAPAIRLAHDGFVVHPQLAAESEARIKELNGRTNFVRFFGGLRAGATHRQPELEAVLKRIATGGPTGFYAGPTAELVVAEMRRSGGLITATDLTDYRAVWREPLTAEWQGFRVHTAPLPSSGGIALISLLTMKADLAPAFKDVTLNSPQYVHLVAEIEKRVFADRAEFLGDPDFVKAPVTALLDPKYLARRAAEVNLERRTPTESVRPGIDAHHHTTHYSVVDHDGNAVSNTYTLNDDFGSGQVVEGAGFLLNNEMDDFSVKPGTPNLYGVVGAEANAIAPGKRPLSSMTPTVLTRDGKLALVIGTPGGSRIFTSVMQVIVDWHDFNMPLIAAVAAPRFHHQLLPADTIFEESWKSLDEATVAKLRERGYRLKDQGFNGDIQAIEVSDGHAVAVPDPRGRGVGRVFE
jgi:gamma-glutamyltranspeptidase/glutathione hydrolase